MRALFPKPVYATSLDAAWAANSDLSKWERRAALVISEPYGNEESIVLDRMLAAIDFAPGEVRIFTPAAGPACPWSMLCSASGARLVLIFGVDVRTLGIGADLPKGVPTRFDGCTWVLAPSLRFLQSNAEAKRNLWTAGLQPLLQSQALRR